MSVQDVIKKSILESEMYSQAISLSTVITIVADMLLAALLGLVIYYVYKKAYQGVVYNRNYGIALLGMTVLTCMVTLAISTNIVISLGMVGALSIVRYRTAIKEPMDLLYMFWAITTGITVGASMYILVLIGMVFMIVIVLVAGKAMDKKNAYIMVVHYQGEQAGDEIIRVLGKNDYSIRSKVLRKEDVELTLQIKVKNDNLSFVEKIQAVGQVKDVTLLQYNGEYHG